MPQEPIVTENMEEMYFLSQDNDSHWYVVPYKDKEERWKWLLLPEDDEASREVPKCVERVGGSPSLVKFTKYIIK